MNAFTDMHITPALAINNAEKALAQLLTLPVGILKSADDNAVICGSCGENLEMGDCRCLDLVEDEFRSRGFHKESMLKCQYWQNNLSEVHTPSEKRPSSMLDSVEYILFDKDDNIHLRKTFATVEEFFLWYGR